MTACRYVAFWWLRKSVWKLNPVLADVFQTEKQTNTDVAPWRPWKFRKLEESVQHYTSPKETGEPTGIPFWNQEWWSICGKGFLPSFSLLVYLLDVLGYPWDIDYWCLVGERSIRIVRKRTNKWLICYILPFRNWCWWHPKLILLYNWNYDKTKACYFSFRFVWRA
jgi:hypothetical protein